MPRPKSTEDIHLFLGMVTYLTKFIPECAKKIEPLRRNLKKEQPFMWGEDQEKAYQEIINDLTQSPTLALYDPMKPITLSVDASQHGLGACILQEGKPVAYGSSSLTETQQ
jgi:hypothetical protein